ncbi:pyridoxamine 5'-phosphate oxidase family protein [Microbacterium hatanonis]|uniref:Pyridoxamine 5'-phosphate oxidase family protein n=1 Tax=Microbacterium hatanonis TaxID=404366 RepID=A0A5C8I1J5_9MICO|nr:pyridoxamine 5'-phosphate oxidase family protein [Microbacterium hatanonis]TXK12656.1 pyridoxamine 5'-phosphate oxidase family protein [Microbacterium hatanonis]
MPTMPSPPPSTPESTPPLVTTLSAAECWALIEQGDMGRIALVDPTGDPEVFPVNYLSRKRIVYIRTANDSKLRHIRSHPAVALEIDGADGTLHWSVLLRGIAQQVTTDEELRESGAASLQTSTPTLKRYVIRVEPTAVAGRRFREPGRLTRGAPALRDSRPRRPEPVRPQPIPHLPPFPR